MSIDQKRLELLDAISELSREFPTIRLGQLICNLTTAAGREEPSGIWDIEDEELLAAAGGWLESRRSHASAE